MLIKCVVILWVILLAPLYSVAYDFHDAVAGFDPQGHGFNLLRQYVGLLKKSSAHLEYDQDTLDFLAFGARNFKKFHFNKLYTSPFLTENLAGFHSISLRGRHRQGTYRISTASAKAPDPLDTLGSLDLELGLKKNICQPGPSFSFFAKMTSLRKQYSLDGVLAILEGLQKVSDPPNFKTLRAPPCNFFSSLKQADERILIHAFNQAFPHLAIYLDQYLVLQSLLQLKKTPVVHTHYDLKFSFNVKALKRKFPAIEKLLQQSADLFCLQLQFKNSADHTIIQLSIDSQNKFIRVIFNTRNGELLPYDSEGTLFHDEAILLTGLQSYDFKLVLHLNINVHGLHINSGVFIVRSDYKRTPDISALSFKLDHIGVAKVTGRVFNLMPAWALNIFIPGDMDMLINNFCLGMYTGGQGTALKIDWDKRIPTRVIMNMDAVAELLDNFLIRFSVGLFENRFTITAQTRKEMHAFQDQLMEFFLHDLVE